jgi:hypothetical protein
LMATFGDNKKHRKKIKEYMSNSKAELEYKSALPLNKQQFSEDPVSPVRLHLEAKMDF